MEYKLDINGRTLTVQTRSLAQQAAGSCLVQYGETTVLVTAVMSDQKREGIDFFPLLVDYEEKFYAAGKILGSRYIRRESRPSDEAILTARVIDRIIRPCFPKGLRQDVQVVITCLSWDGENDPDIIGLLGASIALSISDIPWEGPAAILRAGRKDGKFILNPVYEERNESDFELVLAGKEKDGKFFVNMAEAEAKETKEETVMEAVEFLKPRLKKLIDFQNEIIEKEAKEKREINPSFSDAELENKVKDFLKDKLENAIYDNSKGEKNTKIGILEKETVKYLKEEYPESDQIKYIKKVFEAEVKETIRRNILESEKRPDNRKLDQVRDLYCEAGVKILPRTHGSALFFRGITKSLSILTLASPGEQKVLEGMEFIGKKRFMHHYNFPPYSSGEVKPLRGPGRREIGHGMLAEKALKAVIPDVEKFPYTIRIVSEILSSNGSTSMSSVCSSSLALMDAGVPIKKPVAGIAVGMVKSENSGEYKILTDIQGPEDHYGDLDFKVAGTKEGITAIQMDTKIEGIDEKIFSEVLKRAKKARLQILEKIEETIAEPRKSLSKWAPKIYIMQINPDKIREVIGPKGKIINEIIDKFEVAIDIEETGKIFISSEKEDAAKKAIEWIKNITREVKAGEIFQGKVIKIMDFGAFVELFPGTDGLVHISELAPGRVEKVEDVVKLNEIIPVKVILIDDQGRIKLSLKQAKQ